MRRAWVALFMARVGRDGRERKRIAMLSPMRGAEGSGVLMVAWLYAKSMLEERKKGAYLDLERCWGVGRVSGTGDWDQRLVEGKEALQVLVDETKRVAVLDG